MRTCNNPECNEPIPESLRADAKYCEMKCSRRAYYLRGNNAEKIKAKQRRYARTTNGKAVRKAYEANKSPERVAKDKAEQSIRGKAWRAARKAAGISRTTRLSPAELKAYRQHKRRFQRAKRIDPIGGPQMRETDREHYHNSIHKNMSSKLGGGLYKCLNRFGEGKEQIGSFVIDGDDSWLEYTKEEAVATLFLVTHNEEWMIAHGYTHALTIERDGDGIPIDFFGNYHLHHIKHQHTFEGRINDPSTRREAIRELWALDNLVLIHKDEHKHYHSNDNQPSNQATISEEGEMNND